MNYLLAIDQGTSSTRAMLYTTAGQLVTSSHYAITSHYPQPGWVEQDPEEIWQKTLTAIKDVTLQVNSQFIVSCGITNQRETLIAWNKKTGQCVGPAIVWQDRRTTDYCSSLAEHNESIQEKTGLVIDPYFSASKLHWLLQHCDEARLLATKGDLAIGTVDCFLIWRLTKGNHCTDITNASRTMLFNIRKQNWDPDLLTLFAVPESILPTVYACDDFFGFIHRDYLGVEIPIHGVAGDQQAALIGQSCLEHGMIKATYGTGGFLLLNTGDKPILSEHRLLTTIAYKIKKQVHYGLEGSIYHAGTTIKWLRDELKLIASANETESLASSLNTNEGVYLISSFTGLGAPYWLNSLGAAVFGLSRTTNRAHFARAALEGVCYQTRDILKAMQIDSGLEFSALRVDGGMAANSWFLQFLSDQCGVKVQRPYDVETTVRGAAMLAAIGSGCIDSLDELKTMWALDQELGPLRSAKEVERDYSGWVSALGGLTAA